MKTVILERNSLGIDIDVTRFADFGEYVEYPVSSMEETVDRVEDADVIVVNKIPMNATTLSKAKNLKLICETATGVDNIDLEHCKSKGITVTNVKGYSTPAVAQHTFALLFYLLEKLPFYDNYVKSDTYANQPRFSNFDKPFFELDGKVWGIIGLGEIGKSVAKIASAFGAKVVYFSASGHPQDVPYECVDKDTLLKESDIISIHAPLNEYTRNLIDYEALKKMKNTAYLINVGRGPIIVDADLAKALDEGLIAGAGLDVLGKEPISKDNPLGKIKDSEKLLITPHMAWASTEARERLVKEVYLNEKAYINGEKRGVVE